MHFVRRMLVVAVLCAACTFGPAAGIAFAAAPPNDGFNGATLISSVPFSTTEDTTQATLDSADTAATQACNTPSFVTLSNSVWFRYTPSSNQQLLVNSSLMDPSGFNQLVAGAVLTGSPTSFSAVSCFLNSTSFPASPGTTYYIDLAEYPAGGGGTLSFSLTQQVPPNPVLTLDPSGTFDSKSGAATVSGTSSCSTGASAFVFANLTQSVGRIATISGSGAPLSPIVCDGTLHPWSIVVTPTSGLFKGGQATASVSMFACSFTCDSKQITQTIQLKH